MAAEPHKIYQIAKAQGDITRIVWPALGMFIIISFLATWAATEYAAYAFQYSSALGATLGMPHIYMPFDIVIWSWKYDIGLTGPVPHVFMVAHVMMGVGGLLALILPVAYAYRRTRKQDGVQNDMHGSAHFCSDAEAHATDLLPSEKNAGGVLFGAYTMENGETYYFRHKGPEHILAYAPTRSGKGVGIVIPTLLSWDQSSFTYDIKGENWHLTSGYREKVLGQRCIRFAPWDLDSAHFNPLDEIRLDHNLVKDVMNISTMIVDPDGKGLSDHWAKTGFDLMTGVVIFVKLAKELDGKTLETKRCMATVQAILSDGGPIRKIAEEKEAEKAETRDETDETKMMEGFAAVMTYVRDTAHKVMESGEETDEWRLFGWKAAGEAAQSYLNKAGNEASGVLSTAMSFLSIYRDPLVARNTSYSDFTIESLMGGPDVDGKPCTRKTSFYMVNPPTDADRLKPLTRLLLNQTVRRLTEEMAFDESGQGHSIHPYRLLLLIDEFPSLGKLDVFQKALAFIAGYGLKALLIIQSKSQLYAEYTKDEAITDNCHIRIAYTPNRIDSAKELSETIGNFTATHTQRQYSGGRMSVLLQHVNTNEQMVSRALLTPEELMRMPASDEIVFVSGHAPIYCQKIIYYTDPNLSKRCAIPPPAMSFSSATETAQAIQPVQSVQLMEVPQPVKAIEPGNEAFTPPADLVIPMDPLPEDEGRPDPAQIMAQCAEDERPQQPATESEEAYSGEDMPPDNDGGEYNDDPFADA
ncbi:type IV secretory system conjugative DNA transfer family protein [Acidithiobacillus ferridurans]|uniref:Conjugal transfer protein TraG n=2 Tax=Acidithiobacillus ferridurans TaxID=1232575 RepID=A0A2Z6IH07_ACIFI|nr:type IV secretory system conjugative DNA transfer family protein [Acidithiobacillus ferridurans]MBU2721837.1 type IV secretory system conjugative DNA transfer family protein [Acidithiobacillus ferridurans]MBU2726808.1 type IV secretory system conjugative DNA transfer family protein [Acidithiobacillus ferridurans]BBF63827.1 Conjugal transfer protein TraG [Acidithiobacillus ferridurans]